MKVLDVVPMDVLVKFELSLSEIKCIVKALDESTTTANDADFVVLESLNKMLTDVVKGLENATA